MGLRSWKPARRPGRGERTIVLAAAGTVALHVVVDAFVAPEPGTGARDHVVSALIPLAVLGGAAVVGVRSRPGARATVELVLGALALVGAGIALAGAAEGGPTGDDWTGFLLVPAGLLLVALGALTLVRSRKPGGRRVLRRTLVAVAALLAAFWLVLPVAIALVATHRPREAVADADLGRRHEVVRVETADGLELTGWYVPSRNRAAVLAFPGRRSPLAHARMLVRHGYGVLLLDMRGQGESEGDPNAFGWGSAADVDAAVAYLRARSDVDPERIGGLGLSVGGEVLIEAAAANTGIRAVVSDGAGERSVRESAIRGPAGWPSLPLAAVMTTATAILSGDLPPASLEDLIGRIAPRPILLVHAGHGAGGEDLNPEYLAAAGPPGEIWEIPEAGHVGGITARPLAYERRVAGFLDRALLGDGRPPPPG